MTSNDAPHQGEPDQPGDPALADQPVMRRDVDPDAGPLHTMGGNIGPAADTAAGDRRGVSAGAEGAYAESVTQTTPSDPETALAQEPLGPDDPFQEPQGGDTAPKPVARADEYLDMDADQSGRGADGDLDARLAQKRAETPEVPAAAVGRDPQYSSEHAADPPPQVDAERMEAALRERGPLPTGERRPAGRVPDIEDGPGTSLT